MNFHELIYSYEAKIDWNPHAICLNSGFNAFELSLIQNQSPRMLKLRCWLKCLIIKIIRGTKIKLHEFMCRNVANKGENPRQVI